MYKAINDRIIIKLDESEKTNIITNHDSLPQDRGVVVSVGDKVRSVKTGEHIIFHLFDEIALPQKNMAVIREKSVLARLE